MLDTLFLMPDEWDLTVDAFGNIALAGTPYAQAQDVACACRLWRGEARYDTTRGVPYESEILGQRPPPSLLSGWFETEALTVSGIENAVAVLQFDNRQRSLGGQIQLTLSSGDEIVVSA